MKKMIITAVLCMTTAFTSIPPVSAAQMDGRTVEAANSVAQALTPGEAADSDAQALTPGEAANSDAQALTPGEAANSDAQPPSGFRLLQTTSYAGVSEPDYINDIGSFTLAAGCKKELGIEYDYYEDAEITATTWTSSDESIAKVSQAGKVTAVSEGTAVITATYTTSTQNIVSESATVIVTNPTLSSKKVVVNLYGLEKNKDGYYYPYDTFINIEGINSSSTVSYDAGKLEVGRNLGNSFFFCPKKKGTYTVTFNVDGKNLKCTVIVVKIYFKRNKKSTADGESSTWVSGRTMLAMYKGESAILKAKGFDAGSKIKWKSSNKSVAKVDQSGKVTAYNNGYATITASCSGAAITYEIGVSYKTAIKALRYATKHYNSTYSQPKRMLDGYYDCSSYVWRSYKAAGKYIGGDTKYAPTAAALAYWSVNNGCMLLEGTVDVSKLLPGDLIFWTGQNNGRYKGIYHVDFYAGNTSSITVARSKFFDGKLENVMVARPCFVSSTSSKAVSSVFSNKVTFGGAYGADGYVVYRSSSRYGKYVKIGKTKNGIYTYDDTNVANNKTYYYKARPYWSGSKRYYGGFSPVCSCKKKTGTPSFEVSSEARGVSLSWEKVAGADGYYIYRNNGSGNFKKIATLEKGSRKSFTDTTAKSGKVYRYRLVAYKGKTKSGSSKKGIRIKYKTPA